jgi:hypothetical protein
MSWSSFSNPPPSYSGIKTIAAVQLSVGGSEVFAATDSGIFVRTDSDTSWIMIDDNRFHSTLSIAAARNDSGKLWLYAGGYTSLRVSTDRGISWTYLLPWSLTTSFSVLSLALVNGSPVFIAAGAYFGDPWPYFFIKEGEGPLDVPIIWRAFSGAVIPQVKRPPALLLAGYGDLGVGVHLSRNLGKTWSLHNAGLQNNWVKHIAVGDSFAYAMMYNEFWRIPLSELLPLMPDTLALSQPMGGETWIGGATRLITWSPGKSDSVKLEYSLNDGTTWTLIADNMPSNPGVYPWLVPLSVSGLCRIRITDKQHPEFESISKGRFSIITDGMSDRLSRVADTSIASYVQGLEAFGTRVAYAANHDSLATWILDQFKNAGITDVVTDSFQLQVLGNWGNNVVATIPGTVSANTELIVGAHYDSESWDPASAPGADDNASGTAAVLEIARVIKQSGYQPRATLRFIAFGAEELGLLGSHDYAHKAKTVGRKISLMQNYDMIGHRLKMQPERFVMVVWYQGSEAEASLDSSLKCQYTTLTPMMSTSYRSQTDSWSFVSEGYKAVFNIEWFFTQYYHTPQDSFKTLDMAYAGEIVRSGLALLLTMDSKVVNSVETRLEPNTWALEQNYPNPSNPSTTIRYSLPFECKVKLSVYNILGQVVSELVNEEQSAGWKEVQWNAKDVSSGIYFYKLQALQKDGQQLDLLSGRAGSFVETKKMLVVK